MNSFLQQFVFATLNSNKVKEIESLCSEYNTKVYDASSFTKELPKETGNTFAENAAIKANYLGKISNLPSLADDSGLCVNALNGDPGIYSARWAGESKNYNLAINKICEQLKNTSDYSASFVCVLALFLPDCNKIEYFRGEVRGNLVFPPRGGNGFAYDIIFVPDGYNQTFAEMSSKLKNSISHRKQAFNLFAQKHLKLQ